MNVAVTRVLAWALVTISALAFAADTAFSAAYSSLLSEVTWARHGWPLLSSAALGCSLMGALIVTRFARHPIGWLLLAAGTNSVSLAAESYALWVLEGDGGGSEYGARVAGWVSLLVGGPSTIVAVTMIFLLAPDGRLASPRWRWAAAVALTGLASWTTAILTLSPQDFTFGKESEEGTVTGLLAVIGIAMIGLGLVASAVSMVRRLRRSQGERRQQLRWVAFAAAAMAVGVIWDVGLDTVQGEIAQSWASATPLFVALLAFPVCVAVAVLRHRLFDIDVIVNRAVLVGIATVLVAAGYVLLVVGIGSAVGEGAGGFWPSLLAFAVVAMAFQPLRGWVVRAADRVAYGAAAAPYEALADFSRRLGSSPDPNALLPAVADAAGTAVSAHRVVVRLSVPGGPHHVATWPPGSPDADSPGEVALPVADRAEELGSLTVTMPPGRPLRPGDTRLLRDLADQAGIAFRNARLSAELAHRVDELERRTRELADSRRRLITTGDAERARLERAITRRVTPHLDPLPTALDRLATQPQPNSLETLLTAATLALEELREITRGVFPTQLARTGLAAALRSHLARTGAELTVDDTASGRRFDRTVEAAAYFLVVEATRELGPPVAVTLSTVRDRLRARITGHDNGTLNLTHLRDRVEAAGGTVTLRRVGSATAVDVSLPAGKGQGRTADHSWTRRSGPKADLVT